MLRQSLSELSFQTSGEGFTDITPSLQAEITKSGMDTGLCAIMAKHTSCSLTINENADPRVLRDLSSYLRALVPRGGHSSG